MTVINETVLNCLRNGVCPADAKSWMLTEISKNPQAYEQALGGSLPENIYTELNIPNYKAYGDGFDKEYIDNMLADDKFQKTLKFIEDNEGGYSNRKNDRGGETNFGIASAAYPNEDIKNMTKERASGIIYRDYYTYNGIDTLPYGLVEVVTDNAVNQSGHRAIRNLHRSLGLTPGDVVGHQTHQQLGIQNHDEVRKRIAQEYNNRNTNLINKDPRQEENRKGWKNRSDRYINNF